MGKFFIGRNETLYDIKFVKKTKTLMCLNRNTTWHRIYLFSLVAGKQWFNNIGYSFHASTGHNLELTFKDRLSDISITQFLNKEECNLADSYAHLLPVEIANDTVGIKSSIHSQIYNSYAINLVTETSLTEGVILTEKICKAFMAYQIPILIGPTGACQFFEDIGMDMFSDYIPWKTWDHLTDHKVKINMIVEFLDNLLSSSTAEQDILSTHSKFESRLIKNKEYFHSKKFENILLSQLKSCTS
jgi:hypothetical protein